MPADLIPAARVLVVGGIANLALSFLLGWILAGKRTRGPIEPLHWLLTAHVVSLQEGMMLLGLAFALTFAQLSPSLALGGAWLLVLGSAFQDFSGIINWWRKTGDQFAEKSTGWVLATINAVLNTAGLAIVTVGVVRGVMP